GKECLATLLRILALSQRLAKHKQTKRKYEHEKKIQLHPQSAESHHGHGHCITCSCNRYDSRKGRRRSRGSEGKPRRHSPAPHKRSQSEVDRLAQTHQRGKVA